MIPKTIHYCWFGKGAKPPLVLTCIESWKRTCPTFEIKEWNESNFPIENHPYADTMYRQKKWAFVSDYARLSILNEHGGFYLDTDMLLLQSLEQCRAASCSVGEESEGVLNAAYLGAEAGHPFVRACLAYYGTNPQPETIPRIMTAIYRTLSPELRASITVYPKQTFYPYDIETIKNYKGQALPTEVIGIHLWNYSWGHPLNKLFKKLGIHAYGKRIAEILGIKAFLKKLLGFI